MKFFILVIVLSVFDFSMSLERDCERTSCHQFFNANCPYETKPSNCLKHRSHYVVVDSDAGTNSVCCLDEFLSEDDFVENKYLDQDQMIKDFSCIVQIIFGNNHQYQVMNHNPEERSDQCQEFVRKGDYIGGNI